MYISRVVLACDLNPYEVVTVDVDVKTYPVALFKYLQFLAFKFDLNNIDFPQSSLCGSILDAN